MAVDLEGLRGWGGWFTGFAIILGVWRGLPAIINAIAGRNKALFEAFETRLAALEEERAAWQKERRDMLDRMEAMQREHEDERRKCQEERGQWHREREGLRRQILAQAEATARLVSSQVNAPETRSRLEGK